MLTFCDLRIVTLKRTLTLLFLAAGVWLLAFAARRLLHVTHGLRAEYFADITAGARPAFEAVDPTVSLAQIRRQWNAPLPSAFRVRWFGYLTVRRSGSYTFALTSDDGSALWIDGRLRIDNGGRHGELMRTATVDLASGSHPVLIEYAQFGGDAALEWTWARDGARAAAVPAWVLSPTREPWMKIAGARVLDLLAAASFVAAMAWTAWIVVSLRMIPASLAFFVGLTILETWPLATDPAHLSRNDNGDALLNEWAIAWVAHQAPRDLKRVFDGNAFYPERNTLAFSEAMPLQSAMAAPVLWAGGSPVLAYNLVLLAGFTLTGWTMHLVITRWTGDRVAGLTAGTLFAFNAHSFTRLPHLQAQHVEFLPLALFALDRLVREPSARNACRLAGWFVLQALTSVYLLVLTATALTGAALVRPGRWIGRSGPKTMAYAVLAAVVSTACLLPFLLPYWRLYHEQGLTRSVEEAAKFSAVWRDYLSTPSRLDYGLWSHRWFSGSALFPGAVALVLAGVAVARGVAFTDSRARMALAVGATGVVLSFGTKVPGFAAVYEHVPLLHSVRVISRFGFLGIFAAASLAGFGLAHVRALASARIRAAVGAAALILAAVEAFPGPLELTRFEGIPRIYASVRGIPDAIVVEMPFYGGAAGFAQARYMLHSTAHWKPILNGYTGLAVRSYQNNVEALARFPDSASIAALQSQRVTHVFVHTDEMDPAVVSRLDSTPVLHRLASEGAIVLFALDPARPALTPPP